MFLFDCFTADQVNLDLVLIGIVTKLVFEHGSSMFKWDSFNVLSSQMSHKRKLKNKLAPLYR